MLHFNTLNINGERINQSVPIVLAISTDVKETIGSSKAVALYYKDDLYAVMRNPEIYYHKKEERVARQFGTTHKDHPYIKVEILKYSKNYTVRPLYLVIRSIKTVCDFTQP